MLSALVALISAAGVLSQSASDTAILDAPRTANILAGQCSTDYSLAILTPTIHQTSQPCTPSQAVPRHPPSISAPFRATCCGFPSCNFILDLLNQFAQCRYEEAIGVRWHLLYLWDICSNLLCRIFYFFKINNVPSFKNKTRTKIVPRITSTSKLTNYTTQPQVMLNMGFSATGLSTLDPSFTVDDGDFSSGQFAGAAVLGDDTNNWLDVFKGTSIHGVFLMASVSSTQSLWLIILF